MPIVSHENLAISDVILIRQRCFLDPRGYFAESYCAPEYSKIGIDAAFLMDAQSGSTRRGTIRGLHFQAPPAAQAKLVRVLRGSIFDVAVDLRRGSPTYGRWCGSTITASGGEQLFIPVGFAHGFCTLEPDTEVAYKVDAVYSPADEGGIFWNDPDIGIPWPINAGDAFLSDKDAGLPYFRDFTSPFLYESRTHA